MPQKYKFFITNRVVIVEEYRGISDSAQDSYPSILEALNTEADAPEVLLFKSHDLSAILKRLKQDFVFLVAGGGYVQDERGDVLMIHRRGFWDLPKGKAEPGETIKQTAVREVEEECGIRNAAIVSEGFSTFHLYKEAGVKVLKESVWFRMNTQRQALIPQTEEDITTAEWKTLPISEDIRTRCYASILEVLDHFSAEER